MKCSILFVTLTAALFLSLSATATPLDDKVATLKKAIKDEIATKPATPPNGMPSPFYGNAGYLVANIDQIVMQADNPNMGNNAEMQISQLLSVYTSEAVQKAGHDLIDEIRSERKARADAANAEIQALLKRVSDAVTQAKKAEDLDSLLVDLQKFQSSHNGGYNPENQALYQQVSSAFEFTKLWQNYLSHTENGQSQMAMNDLQNLSQNNYSVGIIPRSQILDRLAALTMPESSENPGQPASQEPTVESIMKNVKTLDDMEPALRQLAPFRQVDTQFQMAYNGLNGMVVLYNNAKAGLPSDLPMNFNANDTASVIPAQLRGQLLTFVLQHYFDSYMGATPAANESPQAYVNRVLADAISREDWSLLKKATMARGFMSRNAAIGPYGDTGTGIDNLLAAVHQEEAGQYAFAVVSYQNVLKAPDPIMPAKWIGDKLAAIQKDHPKEYDQGIQTILSPFPRFAPYPVVNGVPYRTVMPGSPAYPLPGSASGPGLFIPGTTNQETTPVPPTTAAPAPEPAPTDQPLSKPAPPSTNAPTSK